MQFLQQLKHVAREQFNFTVEDGLVGGSSGTLQWTSSPFSMALCHPSTPRVPFPLFPYLS